jgi:DNA-binding NtrC family response regulator
MRLGALRPQTIDVRFVAATHRDLDVEVASGRFREDLYYRIAGCTVHVPPLRERRDEIPGLVEHFSERAATRLGVAAPAISQLVVGLLTEYPWPGNIRELRNVLERAVVLAGRGPIGPEHLPGEKMRATVISVIRSPALRSSLASDARRPPRQHSVTAEHDPLTVTSPQPRSAANQLDEPPHRPTLSADALRAEFREREKVAILDAMQRCAGNQSRAAKLLGMSRGTLIAKLDTYGIPRPRK